MHKRYMRYTDGLCGNQSPEQNEVGDYEVDLLATQFARHIQSPRRRPNRRARFTWHAAKRARRPGPNQASVGEGRVIEGMYLRLAERNQRCAHVVDATQ